MAEQKQPQGTTLKDIRQSIALQKVRGEPVERIIRQLMARGWPEVSARHFVANVQVSITARSTARGVARDAEVVESSQRKAHVRYCQWRVLRGMICIILGLAMIMVGLLASDVFEGLALFAVGVMLCTVETIDFAYGIRGWWRNRN